jgi:hypothetical protein
VIGRAFGVSWYHFRASFHQRWSSYLTVILLIGLVGGAAMGAVAAARRTQSAFPAYLAASRASDLQFQFYSSQSLASLEYLTKELEHLPQVTRVAIAPTLLAIPLGANGKPLSTSISEDQITTIGSAGGEYFTQDRVAVAVGRMADPKSTNEMVATAETAKLAGWHLGETVKMGDFTVAQINSGVNPATAKPGLEFSAKLVGLVVFSNQVASDDIDRNAATYQLLTPALTQKLRAGATYPDYGLRLRGGSRDVAAVEQEITRLVPKGDPYDFHVASVTEGQVERSSKPEAIALGVFGAIAALAALLIAGQAISRALWAEGEDLDVLRALGADSLTVTWDAIFGLLGGVVLGATLAVVLAVILSPLAPLGPARQVDRTPGVAFDLDCARSWLRHLGHRSGCPDRGPRLPPGGAPRQSTAVRARTAGIGRCRHCGALRPSGPGCRRAPLLPRGGSWPVRRAGPLGARRGSAGDNSGGGHRHLRQRAPHPRIPPRALRVELELRHRTGGG